jgi:5'-nucleotidase
MAAEQDRLKIVISNDDGIDAPGLQTLLGVLSELADCRVVAPDGPRSGVGHALSDAGVIHIHRPGEGQHSISGTPADCARLALAPGSPLMQDWAQARRDGRIWLVSGINHGANLGVDTFVSGTAAAAREAAILGFPALAISQYVGRHRDVDWARAGRRARPTLEALLAQRPRPGAFWNVNLPHPPDDATECESVQCPADPSPHAIHYERRGEHYEYRGDYHNRPRKKGADVDVCFGGRISVSEIGL